MSSSEARALSDSLCRRAARRLNQTEVWILKASGLQEIWLVRDLSPRGPVYWKFPLKAFRQKTHKGREVAWPSIEGSVQHLTEMLDRKEFFFNSRNFLNH